MLDPGGAAAATVESGPAAGGGWGQPSHCRPRARQGGGKGERHLNLTLLLPSKSLALPAIHQPIPEARGQGRQTSDTATEVNCLELQVEKDQEAGERHTDVQPRKCYPSASHSLPPAACGVDCIIYLSCKKERGSEK